MSSYLVTGGAGFIGSHLVDYLIGTGNKVTVLDSLLTGKIENINKSAHFIHGSITDVPVLESAFDGIDFCYHLAAIPSVQDSIKNWSDCHKVNLGGSINVFEIAVRNNIPVIYASSSAVYGSLTDVPIKEDSPIAPVAPYGFDKYSNEVHAKLFADLKGLKSTGLRFFNVYGSRQDPASPYSGVIPIFVKKIMNREGIKVFDDGNQTRDFIHVSDVVQALIKANNKKSLETSGVFNVCTGTGISVNYLVNALFEIIDKKVDIEYLPPRNGDVYQSIGDPSKAKDLLGFEAVMNIRKGLSLLFNK